MRERERERETERERERGLVNYKHLEKNGYNNIPLVCKSCRSQQPQQLTLIIKKPPPILTKIFFFFQIFFLALKGLAAECIGATWPSAGLAEKKQGINELGNNLNERAKIAEG